LLQINPPLTAPATCQAAMIFRIARRQSGKARAMTAQAACRTHGSGHMGLRLMLARHCLGGRYCGLDQLHRVRPVSRGEGAQRLADLRNSWVRALLKRLTLCNGAIKQAGLGHLQSLLRFARSASRKGILSGSQEFGWRGVWTNSWRREIGGNQGARVVLIDVTRPRAPRQ